MIKGHPMNGLWRISKTIPACLSLFLVSFGAAAQGSVASDPRQWGKEAGPYQLSISSDKDKYAIGEAIKITAALKNVSDHSTAFSIMKGAPQFIMDIRL